MMQSQSQGPGGQSQTQSRPTERPVLLGRTAAGLFWMFRYVERAETLSRALEAGLRLALTRAGDAESEWRAILIAAGQSEAFAASEHPVDARGVARFVLCDPAAAPSVAEMIALARTNARAVRTALTREVWETVNDAHHWAERELREGALAPEALPDLLTEIRAYASAIRGAFASTMLRNEIYDFARLGTFVERLDGTARLLDVKYHVLLPRGEDVGGELDVVQWEQLLRAQQVNRAFMMVHGDDYGAAAVADFLILDPRNPRSLAHASDRIRKHLDYLTRSHDGRTGACDIADALDARLSGRTIGPILEGGLHEFLSGVREDADRLSDEIAHAYRFFA